MTNQTQTHAGQRKMNRKKTKITKAQKLSTRAAQTIHKLGMLLNHPEDTTPEEAADAYEYLVGLAKCLNFELAGRAVIRTFENPDRNQE